MAPKTPKAAVQKKPAAVQKKPAAVQKKPAAVQPAPEAPEEKPEPQTGPQSPDDFDKMMQQVSPWIVQQFPNINPEYLRLIDLKYDEDIPDDIARALRRIDGAMEGLPNFPGVGL